MNILKYILNYYVNRIKNKVLYSKSYNKNKFENKVIDEGLNKQIKVHFGCGDVDLKGYINIDSRPLDHVHLVGSTEQFEKFIDNSIDEIYLCHVLEHISFVEVPKFLSLLYKKMKTKGKLLISVPDFENIVKAYSSYPGGISSIQSPLYGGQNYEENFHKSCYDLKYLSQIMKDSGFHSIRTWNTDEEFGLSLGDWSDKKIVTSENLLNISLNLMGYK